MTMITRTPCDAGVIHSGRADRPCTANVGAWVLAATILGSSMAFIDGTVVNVALPAIQDTLGATAVHAQWVVEAYALTLAALILVGGSLGDRYGRRKVFGLGVTLFTAASVWCGLAPDVGQLIAARAAQGLGAALLVPGSLAIISASFDEAERGKAIGTWSGFTAITAALGPVLGGFLVENASWRWAFFINVPLGAIVLAILFTRVPESRDESASGRLDVPGAGLATIGLAGLVLGLIEAGVAGWRDPLAISALAIGVVALAGFVVVEARGRSPMVPLDLFRSRTFSAANLLTLLLYSALGGALFFLPFNLIQVQGYSPTAAGAAFLPLIGLLFLLSRWSGGLVARVGSRLPLVIGPLIAALGFGLFALPGVGGSYWTTFFPAIVVLGTGLAISVAPLTTVVMQSADARRSGVASGVNNAVSRTAGLVAVAALGIVMTAAFGSALDNALAEIDAPPDVVSSLADQRDRWAAAEVDTEDAALATALESAVDEAFVTGFRQIMVVALALSLLAALTAAVGIVEREPEESEEIEPGFAPAG